jgi:hypothetical protein
MFLRQRRVRREQQDALATEDKVPRQGAPSVTDTDDCRRHHDSSTYDDRKRPRPCRYGQR